LKWRKEYYGYSLLSLATAEVIARLQHTPDNDQSKIIIPKMVIKGREA